VRVRTLAAAALAALALSGLVACTPSARPDDASRVAVRFAAAVAGRDGSQACSLLTQKARESVTGATNATCAAAVLNVQERGTGVGQVEVWGDAAQVQVGTDVVFLLHLPDGWHVSAAGCVPQPSAPYKCDVDG
jgi:hypothetical protein